MAARAAGRGVRRPRTTRPSTSRSRPRCWSCSSASPPPSAPPSSSTTSSTCPSRRSPRWSAARPPRCASSPPAPAPTSRRASRASRPTPEEELRIVGAFALAWQEGDHEALLALLDPEATLRADGGGKVASAGKPLHGAERIARALVGLRRSARRRGVETTGRLARVNGAPGLVLVDAEATSVVSLTIDAGRIVAVDIVRNPEKLRQRRRRSRADAPARRRVGPGDDAPPGLVRGALLSLPATASSSASPPWSRRTPSTTTSPSSPTGSSACLPTMSTWSPTSAASTSASPSSSVSPPGAPAATWCSPPLPASSPSRSPTCSSTSPTARLRLRRRRRRDRRPRLADDPGRGASGRLPGRAAPTPRPGPQGTGKNS